ncbi:DUF1569 domain-containing protein [Mucilaginibacter sp. L196]|uniref:DUF1569 domain-containing protein n=1 Tax=Mucilaginibacter sp. L196 TaxID=1641870 RepID=UPI001C206C45|nr:DUF1569 domain-containing protein [Mucilaginibacter sp. L196]
MKTVFDKTTRDELISRIDTVNENSQNEWGKMSVYQALKHCTLWDEWIQSNKNNNQAFIGRLFGRMALKKILKNEAPLARNTPTLSELKVKETNGDIASEKKKWIALINEYVHFSNPGFVHPFFGKMTKEQVGQVAYKLTTICGNLIVRSAFLWCLKWS